MDFVKSKKFYLECFVGSLKFGSANVFSISPKTLVDKIKRKRTFFQKFSNCKHNLGTNCG